MNEYESKYRSAMRAKEAKQIATHASEMRAKYEKQIATAGISMTDDQKCLRCIHWSAENRG